MVCRLTRKDHHDHLEEISQQLHSNQRIFWRWLKNIRGRAAGIPNLEYMSKILTSATDKAEAFNHYFCSIFAKENILNLTHLRSLLQATWSSQSISDVVLDENEVYEALCLIDPSKACGSDEIPG